MTGPIIPAGQWPEWADRHCWDADGSGFFFGPPSTRSWGWMSCIKKSHIPMPAGWDWRVPVMRKPPIEWARQKAVELLLAHGYHCQDGEGVAPTPTIDLEQLPTKGEGE